MKDTAAPRRVMIVDDETSIADTMALILASSGHHTKVAYSAEEALGVLAEFRPEVVISDVVMDKLTGVDLAMYLAQHHPECRVLLISGNAASAELVNTNMPVGLEVLLLPKPVPPELILDFVDMCV